MKLGIALARISPDQFVMTTLEGTVVDQGEGIGRVVDVQAIGCKNCLDELGGLYCPNRGLNGCTAPAYSPKLLAQHVDEPTFELYQELGTAPINPAIKPAEKFRGDPMYKCFNKPRALFALTEAFFLIASGFSSAGLHSGEIQADDQRGGR